MPTSIAVPRSGCSSTIPVGTPISTTAVITESSGGGSGPRLRCQATIIGRLSLSSSEGWK